MEKSDSDKDEIFLELPRKYGGFMSLHQLSSPEILMLKPMLLDEPDFSKNAIVNLQTAKRNSTDFPGELYRKNSGKGASLLSQGGLMVKELYLDDDDESFYLVELKVLQEQMQEKIRKIINDQPRYPCASMEVRFKPLNGYVTKDNDAGLITNVSSGGIYVEYVHKTNELIYKQLQKKLEEFGLEHRLVKGFLFQPDGKEIEGHFKLTKLTEPNEKGFFHIGLQALGKHIGFQNGSIQVVRSAVSEAMQRATVPQAINRMINELKEKGVKPIPRQRLDI